MLVRMILVLAALTSAAQAQEAASPAQMQEAEVAAAPGVAEVLKSLPAKRLKALRTAPGGFLDDAAEVIYANGRDGQIDAAGIETYIELRRAEIRARRLGLFLAADLDNDGAITLAEASLFAASLGARRRGEVQWGFDAADADANRSVTMDELRSHADGAAMKFLDETEAAGLRSLILFDLDGNGRVAMDEVVVAVSALAEKG